MIIPRYNKKHYIKDFPGTSCYEQIGRGDRFKDIKILNYNNVQVKFNAGSNLKIAKYKKNEDKVFSCERCKGGDDAFFFNLLIRLYFKNKNNTCINAFT